jgi:hypothetical protein
MHNRYLISSQGFFQNPWTNKSGIYPHGIIRSFSKLRMINSGLWGGIDIQEFQGFSQIFYHGLAKANILFSLFVQPINGLAIDTKNIHYLV